MGKEKSISIEIKENIYGQLEAIAQKQGSKLEYEIKEAIKSYIERMSAYSDDPFFQIGKAGKSGLKDLAKAHDKYAHSWLWKTSRISILRRLSNFVSKFCERRDMK
jgi:hypothetical protein